MLNVIMMLFTLTTGHIVTIASSNGKGKPTIIPTCPMFHSTSMTNLSAEYFENIISFELCTCNVGTFHDHETNTCKRCPVDQPCVRDRRLNAPACDGTNPICSCPAGQLVSTVNNLCTSCAAGKFQPFSKYVDEVSCRFVAASRSWYCRDEDSLIPESGIPSLVQRSLLLEFQLTSESCA